MPVRTIPGTDVQYYLICFDENGVERKEADGTPLGIASSPYGRLGQCTPTTIDVNPARFARATAASGDCAIAPTHLSYCAIAAGTSPCHP